VEVRSTGAFTLALDGGPSPPSRERFDRRVFVLGLAAGLAVALIVGLLGGLFAEFAVRPAYGLAYGLAFLVNVGPSPMYRKRFDGHSFLLGLAAGGVTGLAAALDSDLNPGRAEKVASAL